MTRSRASVFSMSMCTRICSSIWCPIFWTGFSDVIGSWKIIAISAPRTLRSVSSSALTNSVSR